MSRAFKRYLINWLTPWIFMSCSTAPSPPKSPIEEQASFQLAPGFRIELVACEPLVQDPVALTFDEDGNLWVAEMTGFMLDVEGSGEDDPIGRISVLIDSDGDGTMDRSRVFLDRLVLPRSLAVVKGGLLVAEKFPLWLAEDLDGDFRADRKTLIDSTYGGTGMVEHSPNGLWRGLDNWYYNAKSSTRYRLVDGHWIQGKTEFRGQWGISHDNFGRLYYNYNWSQLHADLVPPNYLDRNPHHTPTTGIDHGLTLDRRVFPARPNLAVNRGYIPGTLDDSGRLREFTSACSPFVYRGAAFPAESQINAFVCEPAGNLIKRNLVTEDGILISAQNAYEGREFLASTDERFRPVALASGPDGALYVADMYKGVVEHAPYISEYLKDQILSRKLDQPIHKGRIWRIVPEDFKPKKVSSLSNLQPTELVDFLSDPNGWYRDTAQRLLVQRGDTSVQNLLVSLVTQGQQPLGRLHALWTLEGLQYSGNEVFFRALNDPHPQNRIAATRILEARARDSEDVRSKLQSALLSNWQNQSPQMILQTILAASLFDEEARFSLLAEIMEQAGDSALIRDAAMSSLKDLEYSFLQYLQGSGQWASYSGGAEILIETLAMAICRKAKTEELEGLLDLLEPPNVGFGWQQMAVLNGMALQGRQTPEEPSTLAKQPTLLNQVNQYDPSIQSKIAQAANLFTWPGKPTAGDSGRTIINGVDGGQFALGRQHYLTGCAGCHGSNGEGMRRLAPPLVQSEWVLENEKKLALVLLHGLEGPITVNGQEYDAPDILPQMPSHSTLGDRDIEAIMAYIRNEWGHNQGALISSVGRIRVRSQGRIQPWTESELNTYLEGFQD